MSLRAVLFDVGETLWHVPEPPPPVNYQRVAELRAAAFLVDLGLDEGTIPSVVRLAWDAIVAAMDTARRGDLREPDYVAAAHGALSAASVAISYEQTAELLELVYISGAEAGKKAYPDAREVLLTLKSRGYLLATATNRAFGGERFRQDLADCGLDVGWDAQAVSVEVGYLKPHPAVFEHAMQELGVAPRETLMVGNSLAEDVAGAQRLGITAVWRRWAPDAEGVSPDYTIDSLSELLAIPALESRGD